MGETLWFEMVLEYLTNNRLLTSVSVSKHQRRIAVFLCDLFALNPGEASVSASGEVCG